MKNNLGKDRQMSEVNEVVLCAANSYERNYYLNPEFGKLPDAVKDELKALSALFAEQVGGIFEILFDEEGEMMMRTDHEPGDFGFDEIGAGLLINKVRRDHAQLFEELSLFYRVVFLGEKLDLDTEK